MKKQEEKKQVVLNLSLPLVELPDNQVYDCNHYPESGVYFVKAADGVFYIADVNKEDNNNWHNPLPLNVGNRHHVQSERVKRFGHSTIYS